MKICHDWSYAPYQCKSRGAGVRARGGDLMPETIPLSGFWSCEAIPGSGHLTLTDRSLVWIQKQLPSPSLVAFWKSRCWRKVWSLYFKPSSKQIVSILRTFLSSSFHLIVKLNWNWIPPWKSEDFLRVTDPTCWADVIKHFTFHQYYNSTVGLPGVILLFKIRDASGERKYLLQRVI